MLLLALFCDDEIRVAVMDFLVRGLYKLVHLVLLRVFRCRFLSFLPLTLCVPSLLWLFGLSFFNPSLLFDDVVSTLSPTYLV